MREREDCGVGGGGFFRWDSGVEVGGEGRGEERRGVDWSGEVMGLFFMYIDIDIDIDIDISVLVYSFTCFRGG